MGCFYRSAAHQIRALVVGYTYVVACVILPDSDIDLGGRIRRSESFKDNVVWTFVVAVIDYRWWSSGKVGLSPLQVLEMARASEPKRYIRRSVFLL